MEFSNDIVNRCLRQTVVHNIPMKIRSLDRSYVETKHIFFMNLRGAGFFGGEGAHLYAIPHSMLMSLSLLQDQKDQKRIAL